MASDCLLYVSSGNIPSRVTHTIQIMKMAEAFGSISRGFSLLTASDALRWWRGDDPVFNTYGIRERFRLRRIVVSPVLPTAMFERSNFPKFGHIARQYIRLLRPQIVYTRSHQSAEFAIKDGFDVIFESHEGGPGHPWTMDFIAKCGSAKNLRGMVTTSETLKGIFADAGVKRDTIVVWPNGVDLERFALPQGARIDARRELGVPEGHYLVVYAGSLHDYKGIPTLLGAARLTKDVCFLLIGGTPKEISAWQEKAIDTPNVRFLARVPTPELPRYLSAGDVFVVPNSKSDPAAGWTFSLKLYEYLASRRPTIVSDIPSLRSVVTHGETGLIVSPDDPVALSDAIHGLRADAKNAQKLADAGYELVKGFTWKRRARHILETLAPECLA